MKLWVYLFNEHLFVFIYRDVMLYCVLFCCILIDVVVVVFVVVIRCCVRLCSFTLGRCVFASVTTVMMYKPTQITYERLYICIIVQSFSSVRNPFPIWVFRFILFHPLAKMLYFHLMISVFVSLYFRPNTLARPQSITLFEFGILFKYIVMDWRRPSFLLFSNDFLLRNADTIFTLVQRFDKLTIDFSSLFFF